ncbi:MAG: aldose epimerase family protein [Steroidobacteraceae bacterium]
MAWQDSRTGLSLRALLVATLAMAIGGPAAAAGQQAKAPAKSSWGQTGDASVEIYTLTNVHGVEARIMTYGATLVSLKAPDRAGHFKNIVLGFDTLEPYLGATAYYGATVGRYANRLAKGRFTLDGKTYQLATNDGPNSLHGGGRGFDKRIWKAEPLPQSQGNGVRLTYVSVAGEEGFPGEVTAHAVYRLDDNDNLEIEYGATTTAATPVNLANHAYFNLTGDPSVPVLDHVLAINADRFTPVDATLIPTGELRAVAGTPFDFRTAHAVGARIGAPDEQLQRGHGYDHNWVLNKTSAGMTLAAVVTEPKSGRSLEVRTTQPGVQFYTGNFLNGKPAAQGGTVYAYRTGLCLETQHFPDSPNQPSFPSTILRPGQVYAEKTILALRVVK